MNKILAKKINQMAKIDQKMRKTVTKNGKWDFAKWDSSIDIENTKLVKKIVIKYGWPTIQLVGKKASNNAWLLVQHADHDLKFQEKILGLLKKTYEKKPNSIKGANIAYLTDRVLLRKGKKQEFGTQWHGSKNSSILTLRPTINRRNLNYRRLKYDLAPIKKFIRKISSF